MSRVLAIDPGTSCGYAVQDGPSGTWDLSLARGDSPGMRYIRFRGKLEDTLRGYPNLDLIVYENAFQIGRKAIEIYDGFVTHLQSFVADYELATGKKIQHTTVHATTLKKWATGSGEAKKPDMRRIGAQRFNIQGMGGDEIDALWILAYTLERITGAGAAS